MNAGIEVFNLANTVQIDANWANYALAEVVTINSYSRPISGSLDIPFGTIKNDLGLQDLVFVHCAQAFIITPPAVISGKLTLTVATFAAGIPVTYYIFRKQTPVASNYGMQVFSANAELLFDAVSDMANVSFSITPVGMNLDKNAFYTGAGAVKSAILMPTWTGQIVEQDTAPDPSGDAFRFIRHRGPRFICENGGVRTIGYAEFSFVAVPINRPVPGTRTTNFVGATVLGTDLTGFQ